MRTQTGTQNDKQFMQLLCCYLHFIIEYCVFRRKTNTLAENMLTFALHSVAPTIILHFGEKAGASWV